MQTGLGVRKHSFFDKKMLLLDLIKPSEGAIEARVPATMGDPCLSLGLVQGPNTMLYHAVPKENIV